MEFTASDGEIINDREIQEMISFLKKRLKRRDFVLIFSWEKEFLEWYLDKEIKGKKDIDGDFYIKLYKSITEDELEQLEQLKEFYKL